MSEFSKNQSTEGMSRRHRARVEATRTVLSFLTERHTYVPPTIPGAVGAVLLAREIVDVPEPTPHLTVELKTEMDRWLPEPPEAA